MEPPPWRSSRAGDHRYAAVVITAPTTGSTRPRDRCISAGLLARSTVVGPVDACRCSRTDIIDEVAWAEPPTCCTRRRSAPITPSSWQMGAGVRTPARTGCAGAIGRAVDPHSASVGHEGEAGSAVGMGAARGRFRSSSASWLSATATPGCPGSIFYEAGAGDRLPRRGVEPVDDAALVNQRDRLGMPYGTALPGMIVAAYKSL